MFGFKKNKNGKTEIKNNKKYNLNDLFVAHMGVKRSTEIKRIETIICQYKHNEYGHHTYTDVLSGNKYLLWTDYKAEIGENAVFNPMSLLSTIKNGEYKNDLLEKGYVTKEQLIAIYNALNGNTGYIETKKEQQEEPQEKIDSCLILNNKKYNTTPALNREEELEKLMISLALNKKIALIVGNNGTGKTSLVDQLTYLIQQDKVPDFLKKKIIIEINFPTLKRKETKKDSIEDRIQTIIDYAKEQQAIIFIDEADNIITPTEENQETKNVMEMLKHAANREGIKIIATTNNTDYQRYEKNPEFKQKFDVIKISEPNKDLLTNIITQNINEQSLLNDISLDKIKDLLEEIAIVLIASTNQTSINQTNTQQNPGLALSIIDKSFAIAKVKEEKYLTIDHIATSITDNNQINNNSKQKALTILETLKTQPEKDKPKELKKY